MMHEHDGWVPDTAHTAKLLKISKREEGDRHTERHRERERERDLMNRNQGESDNGYNFFLLSIVAT
jgi:hypothetical protein